MDILKTASEVEKHLRTASDLLKAIHDRMYAMDGDETDIVADEFAAAQWEIDFALERFPETMANARRVLRGKKDQESS